MQTCIVISLKLQTFEGYKLTFVHVLFDTRPEQLCVHFNISHAITLVVIIITFNYKKLLNSLRKLHSKISYFKPSLTYIATTYISNFK